MPQFALLSNLGVSGVAHVATQEFEAGQPDYFGIHFFRQMEEAPLRKPPKPIEIKAPRSPLSSPA